MNHRRPKRIATGIVSAKEARTYNFIKFGISTDYEGDLLISLREDIE